MDSRDHRNELKRFLMSFVHAGRGIWKTARTERNFQFHAAAACAVIICGFLINLSLTEWAIIFLLIGGMLSLELLNTAIEHTVDLVTDKHHPLAKAAKDAAAGAVCVFAVISCIIGLLIFLPKL
ncbi:diacylglycerol kinase family protein [Bacillus mojavensis]|uniref:diacylglycerol kinase family protein n=1 Tax=Bacillus mojavensis TaxID=72360 RepID=UPI0002F5030E|nr:diacylglycerol kinase family protein [Bacillus mojavensis]MCY9190794.1 diacylglycerol kinase family protein [Bacillus mojavensis]MDR4226410.1 diacylglycerol kinase family protein [Bacillus mojavensis]MEC1668913.1 diacylglycerol kinase family protein [Bacillus mojavensis]MEC1753922.1 diacylglycerol kinase family protein [Bacillus mojavensis]MEC3589092.1 diacylglycerol kinase family protein [Bacillus mojavensis]